MFVFRLFRYYNDTNLINNSQTNISGRSHMDIMNLFSLEGKSAIVTGANTGLGPGISIALAAAGAHVFGVARRS